MSEAERRYWQTFATLFNVAYTNRSTQILSVEDRDTLYGAASIMQQLALEEATITAASN